MAADVNASRTCLLTAPDRAAAPMARGSMPEPIQPRIWEARAVNSSSPVADLLRMGRLPEAWIAPAGVRELRELTRYRARLVGLRSSCKDQVHGVLAKFGVPVTCSGIFGKAGSAWLDGLGLPQPYAGKVLSLRQLTGGLTTEVTMLSEMIADMLAGDRSYQAIRQPGAGPK